MFLARVIGRLVATRRYEGLEQVGLLLVQPLDEQRAIAGESLVACDAIHANLGEIVHVCDGREATLALPVPFVPVDATIVGHVEQFSHDGPGPQIGVAS